jgi:hypothetical protein
MDGMCYDIDGDINLQYCSNVGWECKEKREWSGSGSCEEVVWGGQILKGKPNANF